VRRVSGELAELYGLIDRGTVGVGAHADLVVFDADEIGPGVPAWRDDLPGGAGRLTGAATGIESVFVNGAEIVHHGELTGAQPGRVLRSGRDSA
jgi:N-acyl-D-aspartate/D-glutamate deacylase